MTQEVKTYDPSLLLSLYERIMLIRQFETLVSDLYAKNRIPGFVHLYLGQEAVAVGACSALRKNDFITSTHRGHGHVIAKGGDVKKMMAELYGKETGYCHGKGGSMHITDMEIGMLGANGIVAGGIPIAVGAAYGAAKIRKTDQVALAFFGDGATSEGPFYEALTFASAWNLPMIFVCENNLFGVSTHLSRISPSQDVAPRVKGWGIPCMIVNGNDVLAVREATIEAVEHARSGGGPSFIECKTWRHHGHFEGENPNYRDGKEHEEWMAKDPVPNYRNDLLAKYGIVPSALDEIDSKIEKTLSEAVEFAESSPYPKPEAALDHLYA